MKQGKIYSYEDIVEMARKGASFTVTVNPDDPRLANPADMPAEISKLCAEKSGTIPANDSELSACIFKSLACRYAEILDSLRRLAPTEIDDLYIVGGGVKNKLLNEITEEIAGIRIIAGPAEATAVGELHDTSPGCGTCLRQMGIQKVDCGQPAVRNETRVNIKKS